MYAPAGAADELLPSRCPEDETLFIEGRARAEAVESSTSPRVDLPFFAGRAAGAADESTSRSPGEDILAIAGRAAGAADELASSSPGDDSLPLRRAESDAESMPRRAAGLWSQAAPPFAAPAAAVSCIIAFATAVSSSAAGDDMLGRTRGGSAEDTATFRGVWS